MKKEKKNKESNKEEKEKNIEQAAEKAVLISADPMIEGEYAPVLRVLLAVSYMGVFAGAMGAMASLMSIISGKQAADRLILSAEAIVCFAALAFLLSLIDKRKRRKFDEENKRMLENAERFKGEVISAEKHIKTIRYANEDFEEIIWNFVIGYTDNDDKKTAVTVKSGRYQNDISAVLSDRTVTVLKKQDGSYAFENFRLKRNGEEGLTLDTAEIKEE